MAFCRVAQGPGVLPRWGSPHPQRPLWGLLDSPAQEEEAVGSTRIHRPELSLMAHSTRKRGAVDELRGMGEVKRVLGTQSTLWM